MAVRKGKEIKGIQIGKEKKKKKRKTSCLEMT